MYKETCKYFFLSNICINRVKNALPSCSFLPLLRRFNPAEPVVKKSVIL